MDKELGFGPSHRWRVLGIGVAANAAVAATFGGIPATAVFIRSGYEVDNVAFGSVIGAMGLGIAVSELPWGLVTDRLGDRSLASVVCFPEERLSEGTLTTGRLSRPLIKISAASNPLLNGAVRSRQLIGYHDWRLPRRLSARAGEGNRTLVCSLGS
jgi:hypothetical protein